MIAQTNLVALHQRWSNALLLPGQPDLLSSLVHELATYLGRPEADVLAQCRTGTATLAADWQRASPTDPAAVAAFYRQADSYLFELTWWHSLAADQSALVQLVALDRGLSAYARSALDFGSGIGSLGLLLARHGMSVTLAEVNPTLQAYARARFAQRGLAAHFVDPEREPLPHASYDLISAFDVLEHLPDPVAALERLASSLRPGGVLVLHAPDQPDPLRPMHLWHDPALIYAALGEAGLWLEQALHGALILRRGSGPRYVLNTGLALQLNEQGVLLSQQPLLAFKLNRQATHMLATLGQPRTALEVAAQTQNSELKTQNALPQVAGFLEGMTRRRLLRKTAGETNWPAVSIIVPAHGRHSQTRACVESLLALRYPGPPPEIIVVDDASQPPLAAALAGLPMTLLRNETSEGPAAARNQGAAAARGNILAFTDNDCVAQPGWLQLLVPQLDDPAVGFAGGRVLAPAGGGPIMAFEAVRSSLDMGPNPGAVGIGEAIPYMPSCNLLVRRELLHQLGGFAPDMPIGEDVDLVWRGQQSGARALYAPEGAVVHHHRSQLGAFLRRRAFYAESEVDLLRRHPGSRRAMQLPFTVLLLLAALALLFTAWQVVPFLAGIAFVCLLGEHNAKQRLLAGSGVRLRFTKIWAAILRGHRAALYHLGVNVLRYNSLPLLALALCWPPLLAPLLVLALAPPLIDWQRLGPSLDPYRFCALYWLELSAYQVGVWRGCWRWRSLGALVPRVRLAR